MKKILTVFAFCGLIGPLFSQITITHENAWDWEFGQEIIEYAVYDTNGVSVSPGPAGENQTWSFFPEDVPGGQNDTVRVLNPADVDFGEVPSGTDFVVQLASPDGWTRYVYTELNMDAVLFSRFAQVGEFPPDGGVFDTLIAEFTPPLNLIAFPMTYGSAWDQTVLSGFEFDFMDQTLIFSDSTIHEREVDGWGELSTPLGTFQALRIFETETGYRTVSDTLGNILDEDIDVVYSYNWLGINQPFVVEMRSQENEPNPNFTTAAEFKVTIFSPLTSIAGDVNTRPTNFSLSQNYPNPFNPSTTIILQVGARSTVDLSIYDVQGRMIKELVSGRELSAGTHAYVWGGNNLSGEAVPSGVYFYQMKVSGAQASFTDTKKMMLVR